MSYRKIQMWLAFAGVLLSASAVLAADSKLRVQVEPKQAYLFVDGVPFGAGGRTVGSSAEALYAPRADIRAT